MTVVKIHEAASINGTRLVPRSATVAEAAEAAVQRAAYGQSEVAARLGVTRQTIAKAVANGDLRVVRLGRRVLIPAAELARFLDATDTEGDAS